MWVPAICTACMSCASSIDTIHWETNKSGRPSKLLKLYEVSFYKKKLKFGITNSFFFIFFRLLYFPVHTIHERAEMEKKRNLQLPNTAEIYCRSTSFCFSGSTINCNISMPNAFFALPITFFKRIKLVEWKSNF